MSRGSQVLSALFGAHWAMDEAKFYGMLAFLEEREAGMRFSAEEVRARIGEPAKRTTAPQGSGVVVLPVFGLISHRAHMVQDISGPGGTSTELLGREFDAAVTDPAVGTIVLDVSSPGGNVYGVQELADKIFAARGQKRVIAVANALAASAAYWIATAADELVVSPSGEVGSIGVFAVHTDTSRRDANAGVERTVLKAGRYKAEGAFAPLTQDAKAYAQEQLDEYREAFGAAIARNRRVSLEAALGPDFGEGRTVTARQAVARKMADRVGTLEEVLADLGVGGAASSRPMREKRRAAAEAGDGAADDARQMVADAEAVRCNVPSAVTSTGMAATVVVPTLVLSDARQGAAAEPVDPLATTPLQGKEQTVTIPITPAAGSPGAAAEDSAPARAALDRQTRIQELCMLAGASMQQYAEFVASDATPEQVRAQLQAGRLRPTPVAGVTVGPDREVERPFASIGEQLSAVVQAALPGGRRDARLQRYTAASGMNEGVGSEGGYFLDPGLVDAVMTPVYAEDPLLSRVHEVPVAEGRNDVSYQVVDESSRATGSRWGGLQMYWQPEAGTPTPTKPKTRKFKLELKKLMGLAYITEELKEDAPAASVLLNTAFKAESRFMLCESIWRGPGGGQPLGFKNSGSLQEVAIETTQTIANTDGFIAKNTSKMLSRIPADLWNSAVFFYNPELFPYIATATIGTGQVPVFISGGGMANRPNDTIWGRPAYASEFCDAVGTPGDIVCIVPGEYHTAVKDKNAKIANSIHVRFIYDEDTLKITQRFDGATPWTVGVTPFKGSNKRSPFITLGTRA